jgi:hypothetical protein
MGTARICQIISSKVYHWIYNKVLLSFVFIVLFLTGCQFPAPRLQAYREAFIAAKSSGEEVLLDYSVNKSKYERIKSEFDAQNTDRPETVVYLTFDPDTILDDPLDELLVRFKAWEVMSKYQEALITLAEGRSQSEVGQTFDGLLNSVASLSTEFVTEISPFGGAIKGVLRGVQRSIELQEFKRAVAEAEPLIDQLEQYLIDDTKDFYKIRLGLRNLAYSAKTDQITDWRDEAEFLLSEYTHESNTEIQGPNDIIERINESLRRLPNWQEENLLALPKPGAHEYDSVINSELTRIADDVERVTNEALAIDAELTAYRNLLVKYVQLLRHMRKTHKELAQAVVNQNIKLPPPKEIMMAVVEIRKSIVEYQSRR